MKAEGQRLALGRRETGYLRANKGRGGHPQVRETLLPPPGPILGSFFRPNFPLISEASRPWRRSGAWVVHPKDKDL